MREILADLVAEQQALDQSLQRAPDRDWKKETRTSRWSVQDQIAHLAWSERFAARVLLGDAAAVDEMDAFDDVDAFRAAGVDHWRNRRPQEVIESWRFARADVVDALSKLSVDDPVRWLPGEVSARTFASSRLTETWSHGLDIFTALDKEIIDTPRLHHVAWLGWSTLRAAFEQAGEDYPDPIRVELVGPGYSRWVFGPEGAEDIVRGQASDWCRVVVRRLDPADAENLTATGSAAETALQVANTSA